MQNPEDLVASLCAQLIKKKRSPSKESAELYINLTKDDFQPSLAEISQALEAETRRYKTVLILIDALDECQTEENVRQTLLLALEALPSHVRGDHHNVSVSCGRSTSAPKQLLC